jgi:HSP20 family protein
MDDRNWLSPFNNDSWGDHFFSQLMPRNFGDLLRATHFGPSVDVQETEKDVIVQADIPGVNREDLDITVEKDAVILRGETKRDETREERGYHLTERRYGSFYRAVPLPVEVKSEEATARYRNGVLEVRIPKTEASARRGFKPKIESDDRPVQ